MISFLLQSTTRTDAFTSALPLLREKKAHLHSHAHAFSYSIFPFEWCNSVVVLSRPRTLVVFLFSKASITVVPI